MSPKARSSGSPLPSKEQGGKGDETQDLEYAKKTMEMVKINLVILERNAVAVALDQSVMTARKGEIKLYPVREDRRNQKKQGNLNRI